MQTGTANEAGNKRRRGRPRGPPPSEEEKEKRRMKKIKGDRERRKKDKCEVSGLQKLRELVNKFCEEQGTSEEFKAFCEKHEKSLEVMEEEERQCSEETRKLIQEWEEDEANQFSDEEIQMILKCFPEDPLVALEVNLEMNQTRVLEGVTAVNSSSFGAMGTPFERAREEEPDGARRGKRPATAYPTPSRPPIGGFMADARQNNRQSAAALATQGPLFLTNRGMQIQTREATHDREASTSSWAAPPVEPRNFPDDELGLGSEQEVSVYDPVKLQELYDKIKDAKRREQEAIAASIDANRKFKEKKTEADNLNKQVKGLTKEVSKLKAELAEKGQISKDALHKLQIINAMTLGWNLMKELQQSMHAGSEFPKLSLLDTLQLYPSLQNQFNEGVTLRGQGQPINDKVAIQSDDPTVVVPCPFVSDQFTRTVNMGGEPSGFAPPGDHNVGHIAANSPQLQTANTGTNYVEQEDNIANQEDEAAVADNSGMGTAATSGSEYP